MWFVGINLVFTGIKVVLGRRFFGFTGNNLVPDGNKVAADENKVCPDGNKVVFIRNNLVAGGSNLVFIGTQSHPNNIDSFYLAEFQLNVVSRMGLTGNAGSFIAFEGATSVGALGPHDAGVIAPLLTLF